MIPALEPGWRNQVDAADLKSAGVIRAGSIPALGMCVQLAAALSGAGWSSQVARRAHNPKVAGSNPAPAIFAEVPARLAEADGTSIFADFPWRSSSGG